MPELSNFFGIHITMYLRGKEHNPPHIHATYNENTCVVDIQKIKIINGFRMGGA